ncbi:MAG TPA: HupE/UreJ family protein [Allocoleopsis sp.]
MKNPNKFSRLNPIIRRFWPAQILVSIIAMLLLVTTTPVMAHHVMDGKMPSNFFEGFMSGVGHPIIGFDHLTFIVSVGLFAAIKSQGIFIPISFILSAMVGTGLHLAQLSMPGVELFVSGSILLFGILLVLKEQPNTLIITGLTAIAGLFHGYAYGESIFGAEMTPLLAYLLGFSFIQLMIILGVFWLTKNLVSRQFTSGNNILQSSGFVICGIGGTFVFSQIVNLLLPLPKG